MPRDAPYTKIGWREWVCFPEHPGIPPIKAKLDTGARSSALDATRVRIFRGEQGMEMVSFRVQLEASRDVRFVDCELPVAEIKMVRDAGGHEEERPFVVFPLQVGEICWPVLTNLTDRSKMKFRMLLGRLALKERFLVDSNFSYYFGRI